MPYIAQKDRGKFDQSCMLLGGSIKSPGEMNYVFTKILAWYMECNKENYTNYNAILGVLEAVKQEWYRRKIAPYEDCKIAENGDVFQSDS